MTNTYTTLQTKAPFEMTSRYMAAYIDVNKLTCLTFAAIASKDTKRQAAICNNVNFQRLDDVKRFLQPTFFLNPDDIAAFKTKTTMTDDEYNAFFGADPNSFQSVYLNQIKMIST